MKKIAIVLTILVLISGTVLTLNIIVKKKAEQLPIITIPIESPNIDFSIEKPEVQLKKCMQKKDPIFEERFVLEKQNLIQEFNKYNVSVGYNNLLDDFNVAYNEKQSYYSASTVKTAAALYYYTMASKGIINLDEEVLFSQKYWDESIKKRIQLDSMVSLRTLLKYSMTYSDNGAHKLLVERAEYKTLNNFVAETIGTENTFFPNSNYGRINVIDGTKLIKATYKYIEENGNLGQELKGYMVSSIISALKLDGIKIAQKYGWWKEVFHVIGIVYNEYPYTIVVLTKHGENSEYYGVIKDINLKVANFHNDYISKKNEYCTSKIVLR